MPEITIDGKAYPLRFGMGFLREMDAKLKRQIEPGVYKNIGFQYGVASVMDGDQPALADLILIANKTESPRLTSAQLDAWMENEDTDLDALREDVLGFLENSNVTKRPLQMMKELVALGTAQIQ